MQEAEGVSFGNCILARDLEQSIRPDDICLNEVARAVDRAIDMCFGGQVHDRIGGKIEKRGAQSRGVADVDLFEAMPRFFPNLREIVEAARIRQLVDRTDLRAALEHEVTNQRGADEPGAARN